MTTTHKPLLTEEAFQASHTKTAKAREALLPEAIVPINLDVNLARRRSSQARWAMSLLRGPMTRVELGAARQLRVDGEPPPWSKRARPPGSHERK